MTPSEILQGLTVEIIRLFWDHGLYRDNPWLQRIHATWFHHWVDYKTGITMADVNRQIEEMSKDPEVASPIYWGEEEGETPLGGPIGYTYDFVDPAPSSTDPVQGSEQRETDGK